MGFGIGVFWMVSLMVLYCFNILLVLGFVKVMNLISNFILLVIFVLFGYIDWLLGLMMGVCLMVGVYVGVYLVICFGVLFICFLFILVVMILVGKLVYDVWWVG